MSSGAMPPGLPADTRALESLTTSLGRTMHGRGARTDLENAQDLVYEAWERTGVERVRLAEKALSTSPDCADAYTILAEETARSIEEARDLYVEAMAAAERALGPEAFAEDVGHFWGVLETRPYMRARLGFALCLDRLGQREEAIDHYREMLRFNPGDNQGVRYGLLKALVEDARDDEAAQFLEHPEYRDDGMAEWNYGRALVAIRRQEPGQRCAELLAAARECNPHVPAYLAGLKRLPNAPPDFIGFGDEREAIAYAFDWKLIWQRSDEAISALRAFAKL